MIHPDTEVRRVSEVIGNGVFATRLIPKGTLVVVRDRFDRTLTRAEFSALPEVLRSTLETFLYHDKSGQLVLSWDHARLMNHSCNSNTMMTDYHVEIAIRDIQAGEEITTEYGLLNIQDPYPIDCRCRDCRLHLQLDDIDRLGHLWDEQIRESLLLATEVHQPLWDLVDEATKARIQALHSEPESYRSVKELKWSCSPC